MCLGTHAVVPTIKGHEILIGICFVNGNASWCWLQGSVLEGLVASIGCVDNSLSKVAATALVDLSTANDGALLPQVCSSSLK